MTLTPLLSTLPPGLISQIFGFADDFSVVAALAQTARIFYHTWREYTISICQAVAPCVFSNLSDAEWLLDMQEEAEAMSQSQDDHRQKPINRIKRLLFNDRCASAASNDWVGLSSYNNCFDRDVRPREVARFKHAFYCVWTIGVMGRAPHLQDKALAFLNECSPRELSILDELATYTSDYNDNEFRAVGLDFNNEVWKTGCDLVSKRWQKVGDDNGWTSLYVPNTTIAYFHVFYDDTQRYVERIPDNMDDALGKVSIIVQYTYLSTFYI
jgi:hypothetical protein